MSHYKSHGLTKVTLCLVYKTETRRSLYQFDNLFQRTTFVKYKNLKSKLALLAAAHHIEMAGEALSKESLHPPFRTDIIDYLSFIS
jgi:hypothetical protein